MPRRNQEDPTGQARTRKRGTARLFARLTRAERQVKALFRAIPHNRRSEQVIVNESQVVYDYELTPEEAEQLQAEIRAILNDELLETQEDQMPPLWWWQDVIEQPYRQGTMQEVVQFNQLVAGAVAAGVLIDGFPPQRLEATQVITSPTYQQALQGVYVENFQSIKGLSDRTASQVIQRIQAGIQAGSTPTEIRDEISGRFNVSRSSAKRIADTEVNKAYTDSKMNANDIAAQQTGLRSGVIHVSALLPTTRSSHAARHGNLYSTTQQKQWWEKDANRINCFIPGTKVQGRFSAGLKSFYRGKVIKIVTRNDRDLTVTPNHKVMTDRGLIAAAEIDKGDNLLAYSIEHKESVGVSNLDVNQAIPTIEKVFASLSKKGNTSTMGVMSVDFDGDERFIDEDVEAVFHKRSLPFAIDSKLSKSLDYISFKHSNSAYVGDSSLMKRLLRILRSPSSLVGFFDIGFSLLCRHIGSAVKGCVTSTSGGNAVLAKNSVDNCSAYSEVTRKSLNRDAAGVVLDNVIGVEINDFCGHVYDLTEDSGLMLANGIIASNCKCSVISVLITRDGKVIDTELQEEIKAERSFFEKE